MILPEIETHLGVMASSIEDAEVECGSRGVPPHQLAFLKVAATDNPSESAEVTVSASGWLSLEVPGGFTYNTLVELDDADEVQGRLDELVAGALAYVRGSRTMKLSKFRVPYVAVDTSRGEMRLELGIRDQLKRLLRFRFRTSA